MYNQTYEFFIAQMITCSKCSKNFFIDWRLIAKDSTISCPHCHHLCVVTLFDMQQCNSEAYEMEKLAKVNFLEEEHKKNLNHHFLIALIALISILVLFILGINNIQYLETNMPTVAHFFHKINVVGMHTIEIGNARINYIEKRNIVLINLDIYNTCNESTLLSNIKISVNDENNHAIAVNYVHLNRIMKKNEKLFYTIEVVGIKKKPQSIVIVANKVSKTFKI